MKNNKGVSCVCNDYVVSGFAMVNGEAKEFEFNTQYRDARSAKKAVAEQYGCSTSQVLVNFELKKHKFTINCSYGDLVGYLSEVGITITEKTESDVKE